MKYESVKRLFEVTVDGTEVALTWKVGAAKGETFLQLDTESAPAEYKSQSYLVKWVAERYGDLLVEKLAEWIDEVVI